MNLGVKNLLADLRGADGHRVGTHSPRHPCATILGVVAWAASVGAVPSASSATREATQGGAPPLARMSSIPVAEGFRVEEALTTDVDGDDVADLVIQSSGPQTRRLSLHLRRKDGSAFVAAPDAVLDLTPDVVCFGAGDVHADAGREIVLFNAGGAFAWRWRATSESQRLQKLFACELLWQWPDRKRAFVWQEGILDLDGDGLEDLVVPAPWSATVVFQRRGENDSRRFDSVTSLSPGGERQLSRRVDVERGAEVRQAGGRRRMNVQVTGSSVQFDGDAAGPGPYLWIKESVPAPRLVDFDGDGDRDVLFLTNDELQVFLQEPRGVFGAMPLELVNPVPVDRARELDVSYDAKSLDLDGDKRADCIVTAGDKRSSDVRTQVLVFLQKTVKSGESPLFGKDGVPVQLLVLDGFARPLGLEDVDGDGRPDFVAGAVRPDLIDGLRAAASERIDAELYVYRNTGLGFSKKPDLSHKLSIQAGGLDLTARFLGDVTNDGVAELFERSDKNALKVHLVRKTRDGLTVIEAPIYELPLADDARLLLPGKLGKGTWDVFVLEKEAVRCASFR